MKILSKHHDYYDSVLKHGQDFSLIYKREKIEIPDKNWFFTFENFTSAKNHNPKPRIFYTYYSTWSRGNIEYSCFLVGFCGKIYPGVSYKFTPPGQTWEKTIHGFTYDILEINYLMQQAKLERRKDIKKGRRSNSGWQDDFEKIETFFNQDFSILERIFFDYKVPTFVIKCPSDYYGREGTFYLNEELKEYNFQSIVPHMQAFQQIEQYLSGVIGAEGPILYELTDKEKITKAGFDKWSFRTMPTKRK